MPPSLVGGGGSADQIAPPSTVRRRTRHVPVGHPTTPKTKPVPAETKLADWIKNPEAFIGMAVLGGLVVGDDVPSETEGAWVVALAPGVTASPQAGSMPRGSASATTMTSRRAFTMLSRPRTRIR
jgi:hypothetical protein